MASEVEVARWRERLSRRGGDDDDVLEGGELFITDVIHGPMTFDPLIKAIVDTEHFQRLRCIKQLGGSYYVYPSADHSRFVHSLGVAHLCLKHCEKLQKGTYGELITGKDVLCVTIAGLIHDLGHGPFSHLWQDFINKQRPEEKWEHEDQSFLMFDALIEENNLWPLFTRRGFTERDMIFIKELIHPPKAVGDEYPFKGRDAGKEFLYQIVSNPFSGIDVDKMDYIARDSKALGVDVTFDFRRYLEIARILQVDDEFWSVGQGAVQTRRKKMVIGVRDKDAMNMVAMFRTRQDLHRKAYQHKTTKIIEMLLLQVFALVDDEEIFPVFSPKANVDLRLSTAHRQTDAYVNLTNDLQGRIKTKRPSPGLSTEKRQKLEEAQSLLAKLEKRDLPKVVYEIKFNPAQNENWLKMDKDQWKRDLISHHNAFQSGVSLHPSDLEFVLTNFDYGAKGQDPIANVRFYRKDGTLMRTSLRELRGIIDAPLDICQQNIFVYARRCEVKDAIRIAAERWGKAKQPEWATPRKIMRLEFPALKLESSVLSPDSSIEDDDDDFQAIQPEQEKTPPFEDRPETPPLSQPTPPTVARTGEKSQPGGSVAARRNLMSDFKDD